MTKILKRVSEYTLDDFRQYCYSNGLDFDYFKYYYQTWAIYQHDDDLYDFIKSIGNDVVITVDGCVCLDKEHHKVKPKTLPIKQAFSKMITTDAQDYSIVLSPGGTYYIMVLHGRGHNVFKFRLNNDKNRTTATGN